MLLDASRTVLSRLDHELSRTRQAAGLGRPRLRMVLPPGLPESLALKAAAGLRAAAAAADVDVAWLEAALDAEFSLLGTRRADAGLGWLTDGPQAPPAPLEAMTLGEFEPDVWIPSRHPAAQRGTISLQELAGLDVIHGPRRAQAGTYDAWTRVLQAVNPAFPVHRPAVPVLAAPDPGLRRHRGPAHRGPDRSGPRGRQFGHLDPAIPASRYLRDGPGQPPQSSADRLGGPALERRPAPPTAADPLPNRRQPGMASGRTAR